MDIRDQQKYSLIVQGGGQKGVFAAGVLDAFKKKAFDPFSLYIGTSAGALNVAAFVAGQQGLGLDFILNYTTKERFFDFNKFMKKERPMDLDWAFQFVESGEFPLDIAKGKQYLGNDREALACVTNVDEVKDYYFPIFADNWFDVLRATCAIPMLYFHDIEFDGATWVDGGVTATIPVEESRRRGINNMVVISTTDIAPNTEVENMALTKFKSGLDVELEQLTQKYGLNGHRDKLLEFQKQFSDKLIDMQARNKREFISKIPKDWISDAEKLSQLISQQTQKLKLANFRTPKMDMLVSHYMNHANVLEFLNNPPEDVTVDTIFPSSPLSSKGLLSGRDEIINDYQLGLLAGNNFLQEKLSLEPRT